jgi:hypothetical protein
VNTATLSAVLRVQLTTWPQKGEGEVMQNSARPKAGGTGGAATTARHTTKRQRQRAGQRQQAGGGRTKAAEPQRLVHSRTEDSKGVTRSSVAHGTTAQSLHLWPVDFEWAKKTMSRLQ